MHGCCSKCIAAPPPRYVKNALSFLRPNGWWITFNPTRPNSDGQGTRGGVFILRADLISVEVRGLLQSVARAVLLSRLWLPFAAAHYVEVTGDLAILDETAAFLDGPALHDDQQESYFHPTVSEQRATLFEHCARALDLSLSVGVHGLPLMGSGGVPHAGVGQFSIGDPGSVLHRRLHGHLITLETEWHTHHVVWKVKGGTERLDNLALLHPTCHRQVHSSEHPSSCRVTHGALARV
jgi:hypothetical protein